MATSDLPLALIVDDNDRNRKLARDLLGVTGFRTLEASGAEQAIALAIAQLPDIILMDLRLPDVDGTEATRRLRANPLTAGIPIVAMSALPLDPADGWLLEAGFVGHIVKPIDIDEFPDLVRSFCGGST